MGLLATLAILGVALAAAGAIANRLRAPPILGYLVVGVAASPHALGEGRIPLHFADEAGHFAVLLLLFGIGLELDLKTLGAAVRRSAWVMPWDLLVPAALGAAVGSLLGWSATQAWALGLSLALSSTLLGERLTADRTVPSPVRQRVLGVLVSQDVAAAGLLAVMVALGGTGGEWWAPLGAMGRLVVALVLMAALLLLGVPRLLDAIARTHVHELLVLATMALLLFAGYVGELLGSAELGALAAGVVAADAGSRALLRNAVRPLRDVAMAVFFVASGLAVAVGDLWTYAPWILLVAATFLLAKVAVHIPAAILRGLPLPQAWQSALALGAMGEFSLVMVAVAKDTGAAHEQLQPIVLGALFVLLVTSALLFPRAGRLAALVDRLPGPTLRLAMWAVTGLRRGMTIREGERTQWRDRLRRLMTNGLLLLAWSALVVWVQGVAPRLLPDVAPVLVSGGAFGVGIAIGVPLLWATIGAYREVVWLMFGLRPDETEGAGRTRVALVNAVVAFTAVILLSPFILTAPRAWPVLLVAAAVAAGIAVLAWRQLNQFHTTLEDAVGRVLGKEPAAVALLDTLVQRHPWGVRMTTVAIPPDSPVASRTLRDARLTELTGATVAILHRGRQEHVNPSPDTILRIGDALVLMGEPHQIARAEAFIVAHGHALRLEAESRQATIVEVEVKEGSPWQDRRLADLAIKDHCGCLVIGFLPPGSNRPQPYAGLHLAAAGSRILLLGTGLQLDRAHEAAKPPPRATAEQTAAAEAAL